MFELVDRRWRVLHGNRSHAHEPVRVAVDHLGDLFVAFPGDHLRDLEFVGVLVEAGVGSHCLHVDAVGFHVRQAFVESLIKAAQAQLAGGAVEAVPGFAGADDFLVAFRRHVGMGIDHGHLRFSPG